MTKYRVRMEFEIDSELCSVKPDKKEFDIDIVNNEDYVISLENRTVTNPVEKKCGIIFWKFGAGFVHIPMKMISMDEVSK